MRAAPSSDRRRLATSAILGLAGVVVCASLAHAQIWVVDEPGGRQRFTTQPEPGARLFLRTRHGVRAAIVSNTRFDEAILTAASSHSVDPKLVQAVIRVESNFVTDAVSAKGAQGLMQLMPETAAELGVSDVWDPDENIYAGTAHLAKLLTRYDNLETALAAYNAGEGAVQRYGGVPPFRETQDYVRKVLKYYEQLRGS